MLISEIRDEIISDVGGDPSDTGLQAVMLNCIKDGLGRLPSALRQRSLTAVASLTLAAGASTIDLSTTTDFVKERLAWREESGNRQEIYYLNQGVLSSYKSSSLGSPQYFNIRGKTMEFDRPADVAYTIYLDYFKSIRSVVATDTFAGNEDLITAVKDLAKFVYYTDYCEDATKGAVHMAAAEKILLELDADFIEKEFGGHVEEA